MSLKRKASCLLAVCFTTTITLIFLHSGSITLPSYSHQKFKLMKKENVLTTADEPKMPAHDTSVPIVTLKSISSTQTDETQDRSLVNTVKLSVEKTTKIQSENLTKISSEKILNSSLSAYRRLGYANITLMKKTKELRPLFKFTLVPWKFRLDYTETHQKNAKTVCKVNNWSILVVVKSHSKYKNRRSLIRNSWGSIRYLNGVRLETIFVIGQADDDVIHKDLMDEHKEFGDLLQIDRKEIYADVGYKTLAGMQWVSHNLPPHWLYTSADDDMMPDLGKFIERTEELMKTEFDRLKSMNSEVNSCFHRAVLTKLPMHCGYCYIENALPHRQNSSKWYVVNRTYPLEQYPTSCFGGWYTMPVKLASALYQVSRQHSYFYLDDVWITGLLRLSYIDGLSSSECNKSDEKCSISPVPAYVPHLGNERLITIRWRHLQPQILKASSGYITTGGKCQTYSEFPVIVILAFVFFFIFIYCLVVCVYCLDNFSDD